MLLTRPSVCFHQFLCGKTQGAGEGTEFVLAIKHEVAGAFTRQQVGFQVGNASHKKIHETMNRLEAMRSILRLLFIHV